MAKLLTTLEDFMTFWMNNLDFPTTQGLNTSDRKAEFVARFYNLKKNNKNSLNLSMKNVYKCSRFATQ